MPIIFNPLSIPLDSRKAEALKESGWLPHIALDADIKAELKSMGINLLMIADIEDRVKQWKEDGYPTS